MRYENICRPFNLNEEFWKEVLVGRTITSLEFSDKGINRLILDNGEEVIVTDNFMVFIDREDCRELVK